MTGWPDDVKVLYTTCVRTVPLKEANQQFSKLIADVERGESFEITRRGRPVARLTPTVGDKTEDPEWQASYDEMNRLLDEGLPLGGVRLTREQMHERR
jgi:prevent-host-death family protein